MSFFSKRKKILILIFFSFFCISSLYPKSLPLDSRKISINLKEVSIRDAINILAKYLHENIVVSPAIYGTVSLNLKNMSAEDAFNLLLMSHELSKWRIHNVWYIMSRSELMQKKEQELKLKKMVDDVEPLVTQVWQLHYAKADDIARLLQDNGHTLLSLRGHVHIDLRTNILCVQDIPSHLYDIHRLIQRLDISVQQVLIEVHLATVDSDFERELGINFVDQEDEKTDSTAMSTSSPLSAHYGLAIIKLPDASFLHMQLSALEEEGHGELISSPSLFTANQQTASIESGEEIPYQEISRSGATGVAFKKAVLSLKVTPQIMPGAQVLLQLQVNQDKPSNRIILGVPAIMTRQISTNILIKSGQTVVLGGIYESDEGHQEQGVPFLNKIPLVGWLFKQQNVISKKRELLIFVTPKVIS